jgi:hypothetical protein
LAAAEAAAQVKSVSAADRVRCRDRCCGKAFSPAGSKAAARSNDAEKSAAVVPPGQIDHGNGVVARALSLRALQRAFTALALA